MLEEALAIALFVLSATSFIGPFVRAMQAHDKLGDNALEGSWLQAQAQKAAFREDSQDREKWIKNYYNFVGIVSGLFIAIIFIASILLWRSS